MFPIGQGGDALCPVDNFGNYWFFAWHCLGLASWQLVTSVFLGLFGTDLVLDILCYSLCFVDEFGYYA